MSHLFLPHPNAREDEESPEAHYGRPASNQVGLLLVPA